MLSLFDEATMLFDLTTAVPAKPASGITADAPQVDPRFELSFVLLSLSVGLNKFPRQIDLEDLVQFRGMSLLHIDRVSRKATAAYCSEGVFNGLASVYLSRHFAQVLSDLEKAITSSPPFLNEWEIGELLERKLATVAYVRAKRTKVRELLGVEDPDDSLVERFPDSNSFVERRDLRYPSEVIYEPVGLEDFLDAFVGEEPRKDIIKANPDLEGSFVVFNHFDHMGGRFVTNPYRAMAHGLCRGSACYPRDGQPGFDSMLPLVLRKDLHGKGLEGVAEAVAKNQITFVYVQTKFGTTFLNSFPSAGSVQRHSAEQTFPDFFSVADESKDQGAKGQSKHGRGKKGQGDKESGGDGVKNLPYCYIFHHIGADEPISHQIMMPQAVTDQTRKHQGADASTLSTAALESQVSTLSIKKKAGKKLQGQRDDASSSSPANKGADAGKKQAEQAEEEFRPHSPCLAIKGTRIPCLTAIEVSALSRLLESLLRRRFMDKLTSNKSFYKAWAGADFIAGVPQAESDAKALSSMGAFRAFARNNLPPPPSIPRALYDAVMNAPRRPRAHSGSVPVQHLCLQRRERRTKRAQSLVLRKARTSGLLPRRPAKAKL